MTFLRRLTCQELVVICLDFFLKEKCEHTGVSCAIIKIMGMIFLGCRGYAIGDEIAYIIS